MHIFQNNRKDNKRSYGICTLSVLYVILVTLIPIVGFGEKGTAANSLLKAAIFMMYLIVLLFQARFKITVNLQKVYILFSYLVSQFISILFSPYSVSTINVLIQTALLFGILFLIPASSASKEDIINGIKIYAFFDIAAIIFNVIQHFSRYVSFSIFTKVYYDMFSFFDNKNTYGMILFVGFVLLFYWYYLCDDKKDRKIIAILIWVHAFAIMTSMCRTALLCMFLFLGLNYLNKVTAKKVVVACIFLVLAVFAFFIPSIREYLMHILFRVDVDTFRKPIIEASVRIWTKNIMFGGGQGSWTEILEDIAGTPYSHNGYLTVLMTGGLVFFLAHIVMIFSALKRTCMIIKVEHKLGSQFLYCLLCVGVYAWFESVVLCEANASNYAFTIITIIIPRLYYDVAAKTPAHIR